MPKAQGRMSFLLLNAMHILLYCRVSCTLSVSIPSISQVTPQQEHLWSVQRLERQQHAEVTNKLQAELQDAIVHKVGK